MTALLSEAAARLYIGETGRGIGSACRELEIQRDTVWSLPVPEWMGAYVSLGNILLQTVACS